MVCTLQRLIAVVPPSDSSPGVGSALGAQSRAAKRRILRWTWWGQKPGRGGNAGLGVVRHRGGDEAKVRKNEGPGVLRGHSELP